MFINPYASCLTCSGNLVWADGAVQPYGDAAVDPLGRRPPLAAAARLERLLPRMMSEDPRVRPSFSALLRELG